MHDPRRPRSTFGLCLRLLSLYIERYPALRWGSLMCAGLAGAFAAVWLASSNPATTVPRTGKAAAVNSVVMPAPSAATTGVEAEAPEPRAAAIGIVAKRTSGQAVVGRPLPISFSIENRGAGPISVLGSLDGSDYEWRTPKISIEIRDGDGAIVVVPRGGRCGLTNPLSLENFVTVDAGKTTELYGANGAYHYALQWLPPEPGRYSVVLRYDIRFDGAEKGASVEDINGVLALVPHPVPRGVYESEPLVIAVEGF